MPPPFWIQFLGWKWQAIRVWPPVDPVIIVKYLLVGFLYGIPSERQIEQHIQTDVAFRRYLGIDLDERGARKLLDSYFKPSVQRHLSRCWVPEYRKALKMR